MTKYSQFEQNNEIMNVLFAIINGKKTVNEIVKALKEPQSTVSSKLQFLRENDVVIKQKWNYDVNWDKLNKIFLRELRNQMKAWLKDERNINKFMVLFNEKRVKSILKEYATLCIIKGKTRNMSMEYIINDYFHGLAETEDKELRKIDKRFVELKALFGMEAFEWVLFFNSEYNLNKEAEK